MITHLLLLVLAATSKAKPLFGEFAFATNYVSIVDECEEVQVEIGGGKAPYSINLWSQNERRFTSNILIGEAGAAIWNVQYPPYSRLTLYTVDATGTYVQARHFQVQPSTYAKCDPLTPEFRKVYELEVQLQSRQEESSPRVAHLKRQSCPPGGCTTYTDIPIETALAAQVLPAAPTAPGPSPPPASASPQLARAYVPPSSSLPESININSTSSGSRAPRSVTQNTHLLSFQSTALSPCKKGSPVTCEFVYGTDNGQDTQIQMQQTPIGDPFDNCGGTTPVEQTLGGVLTVTDSWSQIDKSSGQVLFSQPIPISMITVVNPPEQALAVQITSNYQLNVAPARQTALVAVLTFNAIPGYVKIRDQSGSENVIDVVYFKGSGQRPKVQLRTLDCGSEWPTWNATAWNATQAAVAQNNAGETVHYHYQPPLLYAVLMILAFSLW